MATTSGLPDAQLHGPQNDAVNVTPKPPPGLPPSISRSRKGSAEPKTRTGPVSTGPGPSPLGAGGGGGQDQPSQPKPAGRPQDSGIVTSPSSDLEAAAGSLGDRPATRAGGGGGGATTLPPVSSGRATPRTASQMGTSRPTTPSQLRRGVKKETAVEQILKSAGDGATAGGPAGAGATSSQVPGVPAAAGNPNMLLQKELQVLAAVSNKLNQSQKSLDAIGVDGGKGTSSTVRPKTRAEDNSAVAPLDNFEHHVHHHQRVHAAHHHESTAATTSSHGLSRPHPPSSAGARPTTPNPLPPLTASSPFAPTSRAHTPNPPNATNTMLAGHMIRSGDFEGLPDFPSHVASGSSFHGQGTQASGTPTGGSMTLPTYQAHRHELPNYGGHGGHQENGDPGGGGGLGTKKRSIKSRKSTQQLIMRDHHHGDRSKHPDDDTTTSHRNSMAGDQSHKSLPHHTSANMSHSSLASFNHHNLTFRHGFASPPTTESNEGLDSPRPFNLLDFEIREQIGKGAFARVHLVRFMPRGDSSRLPPCQISRSGSTRITYAMKSLRKVDIVATKQVKHVMNEKTLLQSVRHPFIVNLLATFQDMKHLYLVMEYVPGGDMFTHLKKHRRFPEPVARFYTAEILLALEYIHSKDIVYRDLKPENILLGIDGHVKIADFGFAKRLGKDERAMTFCGTPAYMAPEIILKYGYNKSVDWWSLGIVCYELQAGYSPFQAETALKIYENIVDGEMRWSSQIGPVSKDLLKKLLEMTPSRRLGSGKAGPREIKEHPWFKGLDWKAFEAKEAQAPHIPTVADEGDVSNFDIYADPSSVIMMQNGTLEITANDCIYDDVFKDF
ncbi:camp-dependent protein kinase catalytic subunit [Phlyctochytrium bullatum]|nr:camp-dependent protein kinase catalytic subunit [Phlyctochytrium bullatum]